MGKVIGLIIKNKPVKTPDKDKDEKKDNENPKE